MNGRRTHSATFFFFNHTVSCENANYNVIVVTCLYQLGHRIIIRADHCSEVAKNTILRLMTINQLFEGDCMAQARLWYGQNSSLYMLFIFLFYACFVGRLLDLSWARTLFRVIICFLCGGLHASQLFAEGRLVQVNILS